MYVFLLKAYKGAVAHLVDFLILGVKVGDLYQGIPHHHMIVLVRAHEAGKHHLARQRAFIREDTVGLLFPAASVTSTRLRPDSFAVVETAAVTLSPVSFSKPDKEDNITDTLLCILAVLERNTRS